MFRQGIQNVFQPTRAGWIIVDALLIQHQRIRPIKIRTQPNRTDEAVLHAYQPDAHSLAGTLKSYCAFGRPYHDIAAVCLRPFDGFPPIRKKTDGSRGRLQKGPGMRTFPSGKANTCVEPLIPFILKTLGGQNPNGFMDVTTLGGHGIHITRIQHIRRGKDLFRRTAFCPPRASKPIMRCPPSRIERHAETVHFLTKQQGLKAHLGGDCVHNISLSKKGKRRNILCDDRNASSLRRLGQIALLFPASTSGCVLTNNRAVGNRICASSSIAVKLSASARPSVTLVSPFV